MAALYQGLAVDFFLSLFRNPMANETADSWDYISFPIDSIMYSMFQSVLLSSCFLYVQICR